MSDLSVTASAVLAGSGAQIEHGTAGASITAGQVVYFDSTTNTFKLADCDSATAAVRAPYGIALHAAYSGQPLAVAKSGPVTFNAIFTAGLAYYLSATAGGIAPVADLSTGAYPSVLGMAISTTVLDIDIQSSGVAL